MDKTFSAFAKSIKSYPPAQSVQANINQTPLLSTNFQYIKGYIYLKIQSVINLFPNKPWFLCLCSASLFKTLWEKEKLLITSNFSFSHSVFYLFGELSTIFNKFEIVVCQLFHFGRVYNLLLGKGLNKALTKWIYGSIIRWRLALYNESGVAVRPLFPELGLYTGKLSKKLREVIVLRLLSWYAHLTLYHKIMIFNTPAWEAFWKHGLKRRKCW